MTIFTVWLEGDVTELWVAGAAVIGIVWGLIADRIAARWPAHDEGRAAVRPTDWRTPIVALVGGLAGALTVARFGSEPVHLLLVGLVAADLVLLLATDLDQRLLPDVLTLPIIPVALAAFALGASPYLATPGDLLVAALVALAVPLGMYLLSLPFGPGAIGIGDLKLLAGVGLLGGAGRLVAGLAVGAITGAVAIIVLVAIRRITLRSYVPYGPFLILGCLWALVVLMDASPG